jgi:hypothetical protein
MFCARPLSLVFLAAAIGCGEDQEAPLGNPNPTPTLAPIPGGGTSGGAINGAFTLFLIDSTDRPVEGAQIRVEVGNTTLEGTTNAAGRADFEVAQGPVAVHAFKANYAYSSALGLGSRALTLELEDTGSTAAIGTVTGTVSGWDLLPALEQNKARVAVVSALGDDLAAVPQDPRPGTVTANDPEGSDSNVCLLGLPPFPRQRDYGLKLEVRAQALFVLGGSFSFAESPPVTLTHVGIRTALDVQEGQSRSGHDVALTHALDQPLEIMSSAPRPVGFDEGMATFATPVGGCGPVCAAGGQPSQRRAWDQPGTDLGSGLRRGVVSGGPHLHQHHDGRRRTEPDRLDDRARPRAELHLQHLDGRTRDPDQSWAGRSEQQRRGRGPLFDLAACARRAGVVERGHRRDARGHLARGAQWPGRSGPRSFGG